MYRNVFFISAILPVVALSAQAQASDDSFWNTELEAGAVVTTGNTDEQNFKVRVDTVGDDDAALFKHSVNLDLLDNSKDDEKTAQKLYFSYQLDYKLADYHSLFTRVGYEDDKFSGFDYQADFTMGYNRQFIQDEVHSLSAAAGLGYRRSELETGGSESEGIIRLASDYSWQVSESAVFQQLLSAEIGDESTIGRSETSLKTDISGNLAMKVALLVKHQTEVPVSRDKTDTETSLTLVYRF